MLDVNDRAIALRMWGAGKSGAQIVARFPEESRSGIMGMIHRNYEHQEGDERPAPVHQSREDRNAAFAANKARIAKARAEVKPLVAPPEPSAPPPPPNGLGRVTIIDLQSHQCRWPYGEPSDFEAFRYCGEVTSGAGPYCASHAAKAFNKQGSASTWLDKRQPRPALTGASPLNNSSRS